MILVHAPVGSFSSEACSVEGCQYRAHINNSNRKEKKKKKNRCKHSLGVYKRRTTTTNPVLCRGNLFKVEFVLEFRDQIVLLSISFLKKTAL